MACTLTPLQTRRPMRRVEARGVAGRGGRGGGLKGAVEDLQGRRAFGAASLLVGSVIAGVPKEAGAVTIPEVGEILPDAKDRDGYVKFTPNKTTTPALRAGTIKTPYSFDLPKGMGWKSNPVANSQSGNYCQPRCDEPWTEVKFSSIPQGKVQVIAAPGRKFSTKTNPKLEELGDPSDIIAAFGEFITGNVSVEPEEVVKTNVRTVGQQKYYEYELAGPRQWAFGPHAVASITTSDEVVLLLAVNAQEKQWADAQNQLRQIVESFSAV